MNRYALESGSWRAAIEGNPAQYTTMLLASLTSPWASFLPSALAREGFQGPEPFEASDDQFSVG